MLFFDPRSGSGWAAVRCEPLSVPQNPMILFIATPSQVTLNPKPQILHPKPFIRANPPQACKHEGPRFA